MLLLPLILSLPVCWEDRAIPRADKIVQLTTIAQAIEAATPRPDEQAALLAIAWHESRLCWAVHAGLRRGGSGQGPWQLEPGSHRQPPFAGLDAASTTHAAGEALWLWRHSWTCGARAADRFRSYAGLPCGSSWSGAEPRARWLRWATWQLMR